MSRLTRLNVPAAGLGLATLAMAGVLSAAGCNKGSGASGTGGSMGTGGNASGLTSATPVFSDPTFDVIFDATLSGDGTVVYFTGSRAAGAGVYSVPASGGSVTPVAEGSPFGAPFGIVLSTDGKKLYVADSGATGTPQDAGRIFAVDPEGGSVTPVGGTDDTQPRALDLAAENGADQLYFAGTANGAPALFKIPAAGGTVTQLAAGPPLLDPEGVVATQSGTVYVLDAIGAASGNATLFAFDGKNLSEFVTDIHPGFPCGLSKSMDEKSLLLSSLDAKSSSSTLLVIDIFSKEPTYFSPATMHYEPGGLHRAQTVEQFAWVSNDPMGSTVLLTK